jgi:uncharacterized protein YuzE
MEKQMRIYYDEEGDFLQIMFTESRKDYGDHVNKDIVLFKDEKTDELIGIGIYNFKKQSQNLKDIMVSLPVKITLEELPI